MPLGGNAAEKNKAGTAFDSVCWEMAICYTSDTNQDCLFSLGAEHLEIQAQHSTGIVLMNLKMSEILLTS